MMHIRYEDTPSGRRAVEISMRAPDDFHAHFRDGAGMEDVIKETARTFRRAIVMPNLKPPVATVEQALAYGGRLRAALRKHDLVDRFLPLLTLYLTDNTTPDEIRRAKDAGILAVKYYPAGATTNSDAGVTAIEKVWPALKAMEEVGMILLIHSEVSTPSVDFFAREDEFLKTDFVKIRTGSPTLKIVLEHISTYHGVQVVEEEAQKGSPTAATVTPQHLLFNRNALFVGGLRPDYYCLPVLKTEFDRTSLLKAVTSSEYRRRIFLGSDSAPHATSMKHSACCPGGCYSAPTALELYAQALDSIGEIEQLEDFASVRGAEFYGLRLNPERVTLVREEWEVPKLFPFGDEKVRPFWAEQTLDWKVVK